MVGSHGNPIDLVLPGNAWIPAGKCHVKTAIDQRRTNLQEGMCAYRLPQGREHFLLVRQRVVLEVTALFVDKAYAYAEFAAA